MTATVTHNVEKSRYDIETDGELAGFAEYHERDGIAAFLHTEISPDFGGRGLATQLIRESLDDARAKGWKIEPFCPFVRAFIQKNKDYRDLVNESQWARFDLTD